MAREEDASLLQQKVLQKTVEAEEMKVLLRCKVIHYVIYIKVCVSIYIYINVYVSIYIYRYV